MAFGKLKCDTLVWDNSGTETEVTISSLSSKAGLASPVFTGTPTVPGYADLDGDNIFTGDVTFDGATAGKDIIFDRSNNWLKFNDETKIVFGTAALTTLFHNGADLYIQNGVGDIRFEAESGQPGVWIHRDGAVELYDGALGSPSKKFETSHTGINVTGTAVTDGLTVAGASDFTGQLKEAVVIEAAKLSDTNKQDLNIENGNVFLFTTAESTTSTPNLRYNASTTLNSKMSVGDCLSVTLITTANASAFCEHLTIDGNAVTENWTGGSAPSGGGSSGVDIHAYTIIKTATDTYTVIANHTKTS